MDFFELLRAAWWHPSFFFVLSIPLTIYNDGDWASPLTWLLTSLSMTIGWGLILAGILAVVVYLSSDAKRRERLSIQVQGLLRWSLVGFIGLAPLLILLAVTL
jgi:hypothetical protein